MAPGQWRRVKGRGVAQRFPSLIACFAHKASNYAYALRVLYSIGGANINLQASSLPRQALWLTAGIVSRRHTAACT